MRQAIMMAIDRQAIVSHLFGGNFPVANSFLAPVDPSYDKDLKPWLYDPTRARMLLAEAGYNPGEDGIMRQANGTRFSIELIVPAGGGNFELLAQVIQSELKQIGIKVTLKSELERVMMGMTVKKRLFTGMFLESWITTPDNIPYYFYNSSTIPSDKNGFTSFNYTGYSNPHMDTLLAETQAELDPGKRQKMWNEIQSTIMDDLPQIPLYNNSYVLQSPKWMTGLTPRQSTYVPTLWIEDWKPK